MAFQLSPGVNFSEIDLTNATAAVATTEGAIAGVFRWGPINERTLITSETELVDVFGAPNTRFTDFPNSTATWTNHETFYTASNFLGYSDALYVTRVVENLDGTSANHAAIAKDAGSGEIVTAKYYGELGNSISVSYCTGDTNGAAAFAGIQGVGTVSVSNSNAADANKTLTFSGLGTTAELAKLKKGDKITIRKGDTSDVANYSSSVAVQDLYLAADAVIVGSAGTADQEGVDTGNAPDSVSQPTTDGIIIHNDTGSGATQTANILASSIISLDQVQAVDDDSAAAAIQLGDPVLFDSGTGGVPAGLEDGKVYFAIPVGDGTNGNIGETITTGNTRCYKLAATFSDAQNHTDAAPKNIRITALALATSVGTFSFFENFTATATTTSPYTGIDTGSMFYARSWGDADLFDSAPTSASNLHLVVKDNDGAITGTAGTVIETYENVSETPGAKTENGSSNFISDVLLNASKWIAIAEAKADDLSGYQSDRPFQAGSDGNDEKSISLGNLALGYDTFQDATEVDVSFILQGKARGANGYELANYIIDNVASVRRDCVAFVSPHYYTAGDGGSNIVNTAQEVVDWAAGVTASTYAVVDSGYKYQYDKYSDAYRWVPLNGDIAGLCARTDDLRDPWFSPAGYNRGNVKNVVKLQLNPNKSQRDLLYKNGVNPVITQPGQGTVLFGDKTYAGKTSAFDRINVRRLFIVLEKTIANAAKSTLFEFNDEFTRATFKNLVEPFLRDVQGRRGIYDFKVVCDESNNTGQVIDTNSFVGDIYIKPARSINFIQLNFVAVRTGVEFSEVVGAA